MHLLNGLSDNFDSIINVIKHKSPFPSFIEARSMLSMEEDRLNKLLRFCTRLRISNRIAALTTTMMAVSLATTVATITVLEDVDAVVATVVVVDKTTHGYHRSTTTTLSDLVLHSGQRRSSRHRPLTIHHSTLQAQMHHLRPITILDAAWNSWATTF